MAATLTAGTRRATIPTRRPRRLRLAFDGARDITPMVIGIVPFGLAVGAAIGSSGAGVGAGLASGPVILGGSAQLATLSLLDGGATPAVIVLSALLINARILLYGASLATWFSDLPRRHRLLLAIPVIDQMHFVCVPRFEQGDLDQGGRVAYYVGAGSWLVAAWLAAQSAAVLLGASLPPSAHVEMAAPLALVGLLAKSVSDRLRSLAAGIAVAVGPLALPFHSVFVATGGIGPTTPVQRAARWHAAETEEARP
ncbi:MAG: AzlC family ABC transporter permease [Microthrixaceae bacterium]|nr:AzlC family ABC transporter permease [Microthrixaceae bacterium]